VLLFANGETSLNVHDVNVILWTRYQRTGRSTSLQACWQARRLVVIAITSGSYLDRLVGMHPWIHHWRSLDHSGRHIAPLTRRHYDVIGVIDVLTAVRDPRCLIGSGRSVCGNHVTHSPSKCNRTTIAQCTAIINALHAVQDAVSPTVIARFPRRRLILSPLILTWIPSDTTSTTNNNNFLTEN